MAIKFLSGISLETNELQHARIHPLSSAPTSPTPVQGQIYYNTGDDTVYTYDGSSWNGLASSGAMTAWILEDDDGTEVSVSNAEEVKFIGSGITTNWTDTSTGSDGDPFDLTFTVDAAQTGITSILATDVKIGEDDQTKIDFETANEIHFYADNAEQVYVADGIFGPQTDSDVDLGTTGVRWKDAFVDSITVTGEVDGASLDISGNADIDGTTNLDAVDIDGAVQLDATFTVGVDDQGYDVKLFGDTASAYLLWDTSADKLLTAGGAVVDIVKDKLLIGGTAVTTTAAELNVLDAVTAGTVTASLGVVVDSNKDIGSFRNITLTGELDAGSLDVSGDADIDGTLEADAITIGGTGIGSIYGAVAGSSSIVTTGALNSGSITSGFGNIDNGSSTLDTGALTATTGTFVGDMSFTSDTSTFTSDNSADPLVVIQNTTNDATAARLKFNKNRGADAQDGDDIGKIEFWGYDDGTPSVQQYADILAEVSDASSGAEGGKLTFSVAEHDGTMTAGLILSDGNANGEIDVTIGAGSDSVTTIAGDLTVNGTTTTINSTTVTIDDLVFNIAADAGDSAACDGAGITIGDGTTGAAASILYDHTGTQWEMSNPLEVAGDIMPSADSSYDLGTSSLQFAEVHADSGYIDAITAVTVDATTDFTIGSTVITDDSIVMTPSSSDTVTIAAATHGILNVTTVDAAGTAADVNLTADGQIEYRANDAAGHIFDINGTNQLTIVDGAMSPVSDSDVDLGTSSLYWKDAYIDSVTTTGNVTIGGDIDLEGDMDINGTLETDALTIAGTAIVAQSTASAVGGVELATDAEVLAGVGDGKVVDATQIAEQRMCVATINTGDETWRNNLQAEITHGFGTYDVMVEVYDMTSDTQETVLCNVTRASRTGADDNNKVLIEVSEEHAAGTLRVLITSLKGAATGAVSYATS